MELEQKFEHGAELPSRRVALTRPESVSEHLGMEQVPVGDEQDLEVSTPPKFKSSVSDCPMASVGKDLGGLESEAKERSKEKKRNFQVVNDLEGPGRYKGSGRRNKIKLVPDSAAVGVTKPDFSAREGCDDVSMEGGPDSVQGQSQKRPRVEFAPLPEQPERVQKPEEPPMTTQN